VLGLERGEVRLQLLLGGCGSFFLSIGGLGSALTLGSGAGCFGAGLEKCAAGIASLFILVVTYGGLVNYQN